MLVLEIILLLYFLYVVIYTFLFSFAGLLQKDRELLYTDEYNKIAVFIPAYKEDGVIVEVAQKALEQDYPSDHYDIIVIADSLHPSTVTKLKTLPIIVTEVVFDKSTKVRSLNTAMSQLNGAYEMAVVLDADNVMEKDFLKKINHSYNEGNLVIQGKRVAKNLNTSFAILDALSEIINNHIYRKGTCALGLSSSLIGSGMAFKYDLFKKTLLSMDSIGGFDRELEVRLLREGHKAVYLDKALVYDEKVEKAEVFTHQRRRWISSQYIYLKKYFWKGMKSLLVSDWAYFNSSVLRNIQLPRVINIGLLFVITILSFILQNYLSISPWIWFWLLGTILASFVMAVPRSFYTRDFYIAILSIPKAFLIMFSLLFRLKGANKRFIHTPHGTSKAA